MTTISKRIDALEGGRGIQRIIILRQSLEDKTDPLWYDEEGTAYTEAQIAATDDNTLIIRVVYTDDWRGPVS
jgi:hypothetical protein